MNIPCANPPVVCVPGADGDDALLANASVETADVRMFFSRRFALRSSTFCEATTQLSADLCALNPPDAFDSDVIFSSAEQTCEIDCSGFPLSYTVPAGSSLGLTQAAADAAAYALACTGAAIVCGGGSGTLVPNDAQLCSVVCQDGSVVSATVPAGAVQGFSKSEANASAYAIACQAAAAQCPDIPPPNFGNAATSATSDCPPTGDSVGGTFTFHVAENTFFASTLAEANATAQSYADQQAVLQRSCLTGLNVNTCLGSSYSSVITTSLPGTITWSLVSGSLPPGLSFSDGMITGTSLATGSYSFAVTALSSNGNSTTRTFTICVNQITNAAALPQGMPSVPYSVTFVIAPICSGGGEPPATVWKVTSGSLPPGLSLDASTGVLSGTPTTNGAYGFTITVNTPSTCSKAFTLAVDLLPLDWWQMDEANITPRIGSVNGISLTCSVNVTSVAGGKYGNATALNSTGGGSPLDASCGNISAPVTGLAYAGNGIDAFIWIDNPAGLINSDTILLLNFADSAGVTVWFIKFTLDNQVGIEYEMTGGASGNIALATSSAYRFFELYYDPTLTRLGLRINDGALMDQWITIAAPPVTAKGAISITYDRRTAGASAANVCEMAVYPAVLNATQRAYLYQGGLGRTWPVALP